MISLLLIRKIAELFVYMLLGFLLVRLHILREEDAKPLSKISLYLMMPAVIVNACQITLTPEIRDGVFYCFGLAIVVHLVFILIAELYGRLFHASEVEKASVIYANCGNLIIPIVSFVLGEEWVIYTTAYCAIFNLFCWTHGKRLFDRKAKLSFRFILTNVNILCVIVGFGMLFAGIRLTGIPAAVVDTLGGFLGPFSMLITGVIIGGMDYRRLFLDRRVYKLLCLRMLLCPFVILLLIKLLSPQRLVAAGEEITLLSFFAAAAPCAATVNQLAIVYDRDAEYASALNIVTTLSCILTMPALVFLYELWIQKRKKLHKTYA